MSVIKDPNKISSKMISIGELLKNTDFYFLIPNYQRKYSWLNKQLQEFINSFFEIYNFEEMRFNDEIEKLFFGQIILQKNKNIDHDHYFIVDGQQRIITFLIFLLVIKDIIVEFEREPINAIYLAPNSKAKEQIEYIRHTISESIFQSYLPGENNELKIMFEEENNIDKNSLDFLISKTDSSTKIRAKGKIISAYHFLKNKIHELIHELKIDNNGMLKLINDLFKIVFKKSYLLEMILEDEISNSFDFFENLNNRGLDLLPFDLIHGFIISQAKNINNNVYQEYNNLIQNFLKNNSNNSLLNDYFNFFISALENDFVSKDKMYETFKKHFSKDKTKFLKQVINNFKELDDFNNDKTNILSQSIKWLKRKKIYPVYSLLTIKEYSQLEKETFMMNLLKYSIIELNVYNKSPGKFQYKIKAILKLIAKSENKISFETCLKEINEINNDFQTYKNRDDFIDNAKKIKFSNELGKVFLLLIYHKEQPNSVPLIDKLNLEHILPQKPSKEWFEDKNWKELKNNDELENYIYSLGNMILLEENINKSSSNKTLSEKQKRFDFLTKHHNDILKVSKWNLPDFENFSPEYIITRTQDLIDYIYDNNILLFYRN